MQGHVVSYGEHQPSWLSFRSLGLSHDTFEVASTPRAELFKRFMNELIVPPSASILAVRLESMEAYGLSRFSSLFGHLRDDVSFFLLSRLILPPLVLALPFLVIYKSPGLPDTRIELIPLYALRGLPVAIWIILGQFAGIPPELKEAAPVIGWGPGEHS